MYVPVPVDVWQEPSHYQSHAYSDPVRVVYRCGAILDV